MEINKTLRNNEFSVVEYQQIRTESWMWVGDKIRESQQIRTEFWILTTRRFLGVGIFWEGDGKKASNPK